jgi:hypothetical protein
MKRPSCKHGGKRFSYTSMVPSASIFYRVFDIDETKEKKVKKMRKINSEELQGLIGGLSTSVRIPLVFSLIFEEKD